MLYNKFNFRIKDFVSKDRTREELTGIFVEPNGTTATDAYSLIRVSGIKREIREKEIKENFKSFILPSEKAKEVERLAKEIERKAVVAELNYIGVLSRKEDRVRVGKKDERGLFDCVESYLIEGEYPKYKDLLVERGKHIEIIVNPAFLERIAKFFKEFSKENRVKIRIPVKEKQPIRFYEERENQKAVALLMPMTE